MRVALKIAYDGAAFSGLQRQPDQPTVEGECLRALGAAGVISDPASAFFRSASRTDRGASAIGNVIAFNTAWTPAAVLGIFNDRARNVWAWAYAVTSDDFHPRRAIARWYRYHLFDDPPLDRVRRAAEAYTGVDDAQLFAPGVRGDAFRIDRIEITRDGEVTLIDFHAQSFRRHQIRRIVAAIAAHGRGEIEIPDTPATVGGTPRDFGLASAEALFLMDVRYDFSFVPLLKERVRARWRSIERVARLRLRFAEALAEAVQKSLPEKR